MTDPTEAAAGYELPAETAPPAEPATGQPAQPAQQSGAEFRKKYEDALQELAQLKTELKTEKRQRTLGDAVKAAGLSEAALELYPKDAEATPEAVKAWAE